MSSPLSRLGANFLALSPVALALLISLFIIGDWDPVGIGISIALFIGSLFLARYIRKEALEQSPLHYATSINAVPEMHGIRQSDAAPKD